MMKNSDILYIYFMLGKRGVTLQMGREDVWPTAAQQEPPRKEGHDEEGHQLRSPEWPQGVHNRM